MDNFTGRCAVITGGASGIGLGLAQHAAALGMKIILADIEEKALHSAAQTMPGTEVVPVVCDVSDPKQVAELLAKSIDSFGTVELLFNNAGVSGGGAVATTSLQDWQWVLGVNLMGVIYMLNAFVPAMIKQSEGHIVNTASIAGLATAPYMNPYNVSKHGVVTLSEGLFSELRNDNSNIGVSVLCPSYVQTNIHRAERNRPEDLSLGKSKEERMEMEESEMAIYDTLFREAMGPAAVAELVFDAIRSRQFYILTHPQGSHELVRQRMQAILDNGEPPLKAPDFPA